jgi:predicted amidohydrolase YtcJ
MRSTPLRSLRKASVLLGGGSDSGVTPIDPLLGVQSAVLHPNEAERISVEDALQLFTSSAARLAFMEHEIGSIAEGRKADLAVLSEDPTGCDPSRLADIVVEETWVGGRVMWRRRCGGGSPELRMGD